jgi:hypothetical protein
MRKWIIILFLIGFHPFVWSQSLELNQRCRTALEEILALRIEKGRMILKIEQDENPSNKIPLLIENYADFLKVFIDENRDDLFHLQSQKRDRIAAIEAVSEQNPLKNWALGSIYLQSAFARTKFEEHYAAALEIRKAFLLLESNQVEFPSFLPDRAGLGLIYALIGSVPPQYQWVVKIASMKGSVQDGRAMLYSLLEALNDQSDYDFLHQEALFFLSFIEMNLNPDKEKAAQLLPMFRFFDQNNLLLTYAKANLEVRIGRNDAALRTLAKRPSSDEYLKFHYLDYLQGEALLRKLDTIAQNFYSSFLKNYHGRNYRTDALRKIGWIALIKGDSLTYASVMKKVASELPGQVETDHQAVREADAQKFPHVDLLKARLFFDGGYYVKAKVIMLKIEKQVENLNEDNLLEFYYRFGRIEHALGNTEKAKEYYHYTYSHGARSTLYFAANAALMAGEISELDGDTKQATALYKLCLSMKPEEYRQGIHLKAKAGLNRLEKESE